MSKILVTGAAGFLGSHLCDRLLAEGHEVIGFDNLMTGSLENLKSVEREPRFHFELGDVRKPLNLYVDIIFNLACPASPVHYQNDPYATFTTSVIGVNNLIEMVRGRHCPIIHTSTSEVYGDPLVFPQSENYWGNVNPVGPRSCYDEGKRGAETLLNDARRAGMDTRIIRLFNVYGPRMALDDGRIVSNFVLQALRGDPITVHGDGTQTRSFCYYDDIIEALWRVYKLEKLSTPLNLGNPIESTVIEFARLVKKLLDSPSPIEYTPLPIDDPKRRLPDITLARTLLDWEPKVRLEGGIKTTAISFQKRLKEMCD